MPDQTINLPQLLIVLLLGGLAIRYFFFSSSSPTNDRPSASNSNHLRAREADVERIQQMFPQVSRRNIMWDLQRNGGNVVATTERVLSGRGLEEPPQSFQPPLPIPTTSSTSNPISSTSSTQSKPQQPDLITRYNLKAKILEEATGAGVEEEGQKQTQTQGQAWSSNKAERQALLQRRREEMILQARRKMEARVAKEAAGS